MPNANVDLLENLKLLESRALVKIERLYLEGNTESTETVRTVTAWAVLDLAIKHAQGHDTSKELETVRGLLEVVRERAAIGDA